VIRPGSRKPEPQFRLVASLALTTDGRHVLTGESDGSVRTQTTSAGVAVGTLANAAFEPGCARPNQGSMADGRFYAPAFLMALGPDGRSVALTHGNCLVVRDLLTQKTLAILHENPAGFAFRPDGTLLVASRPEFVAGRAARQAMFRVWDWRTNTTREAVSPAVGGAVGRLDMSADGRHAAVGTAVFVWDGDLGRQIGRLPVPVGTAGMAFSADGSRIATFGLDGAVRVWDTDRLQLLLTLTDDDQHAGIAFTRDGRLVAARSTGGLTVWQTQKPMCTFCFGIQRNQASR
jgi:WD40 repeat protein